VIRRLRDAGVEAYRDRTIGGTQIWATAQPFWDFAMDGTVGAVLCNFVMDNHIHNV